MTTTEWFEPVTHSDIDCTVCDLTGDDFSPSSHVVGKIVLLGVGLIVGCVLSAWAITKFLIK